MPLRRIYSQQPLRDGAIVTLDKDAANHVIRVLRLRRGDRLTVFDGSGRDFDGELVDLGRASVTVQISSSRAIDAESPLYVSLLQGICRGPRMDTVIQKATELGVTAIQPVISHRSVVRLDEDQAQRKREHWQRVAVAAAEQSGRSVVPAVALPKDVATAVEAAAELSARLVLDPAGESLSVRSLKSGPVALLVGPEGGLTDDELRIAANSGFHAVRLGPRILRTETAPLAALAVLQFMAGDLG